MSHYIILLALAALLLFIDYVNLNSRWSVKFWFSSDLLPEFDQSVSDIPW